VKEKLTFPSAASAAWATLVSQANTLLDYNTSSSKRSLGKVYLSQASERYTTKLGCMSAA